MEQNPKNQPSALCDELTPNEPSCQVMHEMIVLFRLMTSEDKNSMNPLSQNNKIFRLECTGVILCVHEF